jgi:transketolase
MGDIADKWRSFGWFVQEINGNEAGEILRALAVARATPKMPCAIVARTVPGYPVSFLMGRMDHYAKLNSVQAEAALAELEDDAPSPPRAPTRGAVR